MYPAVLAQATLSISFSAVTQLIFTSKWWCRCWLVSKRFLLKERE